MAFFVFDLDGTLALIEHRRHFMQGPVKDHRAFYAACVKDEPNLPVIAALNAHRAAGHNVEIWSGRSDEVLQETRDWLEEHGIQPNLLTRMRAAGDYTKDHVLKAKWLAEADPKPDAIYDDRPSVVAMWRANGVPCFQVAEDWEGPQKPIRGVKQNRLILLIGPSGAGKSHLAHEWYAPDEIISTDRVRAHLLGDFKDQSRGDDVFEVVRRLAKTRLDCGLSAVIDATHLRRRTRLEHVRLAPPGVPVDYVIIDRPLAEKIKTGGWRTEVKPDKIVTLIEKHHSDFQSQLADVLAGDGLPNVTVVDMRTQAAA